MSTTDGWSSGGRLHAHNSDEFLRPTAVPRPASPPGGYVLRVATNHRLTAWTSPRPVALAALVRVAGTRWEVEERSRAGTDEVGPDQHQVRPRTFRQRDTTLTVFAHATLAARDRANRPQAT
jgi:hypothetical protein